MFQARKLRLEPLEQRQVLAIVVDIAIDERDNSIVDGDISLRDAILEAPNGEIIVFSTDPQDGLDGATIALSSNWGEIAFSKSLTIDASMLPNGITIDAATLADPTPTVKNGDGIRIFNILNPLGVAPPVVEMRGLKLTGADYSGNGGAIYSQGYLTLEEMEIVENAAGWGAETRYA